MSLNYNRKDRSVTLCRVVPALRRLAWLRHLPQAGAAFPASVFSGQQLLDGFPVTVAAAAAKPAAEKSTDRRRKTTETGRGMRKNCQGSGRRVAEPQERGIKRRK